MCICKKKLQFLIIIKAVVILLMSFLFIPISADTAGESDEETPKVLVVFSSKNGEIDEHQRKLDMLLGHFTENIFFKASSEVQKKDLNQVTHFFYYGRQKEKLPQDFLQMLKNYSGVVVAIGNNVEQMGERFSFLELLPDEVPVDYITLAQNPNKYLSFSPKYIFNMYLVDINNSKLLLVGKKGNNEYPLFVKKNNNYYFASSYIPRPFTIAFGEMLYDVFNEGGSLLNPAYIRLEDVHPLVDPKKLMNIAKILKKKDIPYMIAVIPVYTNPKTGKQYHFSDSPKLLKVLKYMQKNGGSIILHGYTHQFRLSETGEGFEFWDVKYNMPIYHTQNEKVVIKLREDFKSDKEFENYINEKKKFERNYIETRLTRGIQELSNYGLYPIAFEAPHYAISQHGYQVVSEYFSTYVGHLQISDETWQESTTAPYVTKPTFLYGMTLLPETIGYVDPKEPCAVEKMINRAQEYQFVRGGIIGGFYHPYLGEEIFTKLIKEMEKVSHISWVDLKKINNRVSTKNVQICTKSGQIKVRINHCELFLTSLEYLTYHIEVLINRVLWGVACIGFIAVIVFTCSIFISIKYNK